MIHQLGVGGWDCHTMVPLQGIGEGCIVQFIKLIMIWIDFDTSRISNNQTG